MATVGYEGLEGLRVILLSDALETILKCLNRIFGNDWGNLCRLFAGRKAGNLMYVHIYQI